MDARQSRFIRATFYVRGLRPILMMIDRLEDTISTIKERIADQLNITNTDAHCLYLENGARVDNVGLIEHNDQIMMEDYSKFGWDKTSRNYSSNHGDPLDYYSPFG
jgi:hypothetical protein